MASDMLTRWGISLATTALAAAVVVGCAPHRQGPEDPVAPEQVPVSTAPATGPEKTPKTTAPQTTDAGAPDVQPDDRETVEDATAEDPGTSPGSPDGTGGLFHPGLSAGHD